MNQHACSAPTERLWTSPQTLRVFGPSDAPAILCLHGFGDEGSMFEPLAETNLVRHYRLVVVDLPGFGEEPPFAQAFATISRLAQAVAEIVHAEQVGILVGHSAASIIASWVANRLASGISAVISLEGNLTAEDAYFTGLVEEFEHPEAFQTALLEHLQPRAADDPLFARYSQCVRKAQPHALWTLAMEVTALSKQMPPGQMLQHSSRATYLYNPDNCPTASLEWLESSGITATVLEGASHWPTLDAPDRTADAILAAAQL